MVRGEIWWANLPPPGGSAPAKRRPVLVIQSDSFNRSAINTVICAIIIDKSDLSDLVCMLPRDIIQRVNSVIKQVMDI
jgi:mRNA interferase MazF